MAADNDDVDYRDMGLRHAVAFFAYVRRSDPTPPGARVVMDMALHFAEFIRTGELPAEGGDA